MSVDREPSDSRSASPSLERRESLAPGGVRVGRIVGVDEIGNADVTFTGMPGTKGRLPALSTIALSAADVGRRVVLAFEEERPESPIIMGLIHEPLDALIDTAPRQAARTVEVREDEHAVAPSSRLEAAPFEARIDEERVVLTAEKEIVLRCGAASITLHKDGRVLIRGANVVSRSSGPNRIKGASVQVN